MKQVESPLILLIDLKCFGDRAETGGRMLRAVVVGIDGCGCWLSVGDRPRPVENRENLG